MNHDQTVAIDSCWYIYNFHLNGREKICDLGVMILILFVLFELHLFLAWLTDFDSVCTVVKMFTSCFIVARVTCSLQTLAAFVMWPLGDFKRETFPSTESLRLKPHYFMVQDTISLVNVDMHFRTYNFGSGYKMSSWHAFSCPLN